MALDDHRLAQLLDGQTGAGSSFAEWRSGKHCPQLRVDRANGREQITRRSPVRHFGVRA